MSLKQDTIIVRLGCTIHLFISIPESHIARENSLSKRGSRKLVMVNSTVDMLFYYFSLYCCMYAVCFQIVLF